MDRTSAICTSLASFVEMFALATSFSVSQLIVLSSFAVDVSAVSSLCNDAQKMLKAFSVLTSLCIQEHQERGSQLSTWI